MVQLDRCDRVEQEWPAEYGDTPAKLAEREIATGPMGSAEHLVDGPAWWAAVVVCRCLAASLRSGKKPLRPPIPPKYRKKLERLGAGRSSITTVHVLHMPNQFDFTDEDETDEDEDGEDTDEFYLRLQ